MNYFLNLNFLQNDISFELAEKVPVVEGGELTEEAHSNNNSTESSELNKKSVRKQMEELAAARGLKTELVFVKPPGYTYNIG